MIHYRCLWSSHERLVVQLTCASKTYRSPLNKEGKWSQKLLLTFFCLLTCAWCAAGLIILACPAGVFGQNCSKLCQCSGDQEQCHPVTGKCSCLPGYYGPRCGLSKYTVNLLLQPLANKTHLLFFSFFFFLIKQEVYWNNCGCGVHIWATL